MSYEIYINAGTHALTYTIVSYHYQSQRLFQY